MSQVTARIGRGDEASAPITIEYEFGKNIKEAVAKFGEEVVYSHFLSSGVIALQSRMRAAMAPDVDAGKKPSAAKVTTALNDWKLGIRQPGVSKLEKAKKFVGAMSDEEKAALLKELQAAS